MSQNGPFAEIVKSLLGVRFWRIDHHTPIKGALKSSAKFYFRIRISKGNPYGVFRDILRAQWFEKVFKSGSKLTKTRVKLSKSGVKLLKTEKKWDVFERFLGKAFEVRV